MRKTIMLLSFIIIFVAIENLYSSGTSGCSFKWDDTITLTEDKTFNCLDIENTANVDFNGYTVTVNTNVTMNGGVVNLNGGTFDIGGFGGSLNQKGGTLNINKGKLHVYGNYSIEGDSYLEMTNAGDNATVEGNFTMRSNKNHEYRLTNGVLEIKGDFKQEKTVDSRNFKTSDNHTVILSGESPQNVYFDSYANGDSGFAYFELRNPAGINFQSPFRAMHMSNPDTVTINTMTLIDTEWTLSQTTFIDGDLTLQNSSTATKTNLNLNGNTLNIKGNFTLDGPNTSGITVNISDGTLVIDNSTGGGNLEQKSGTINTDNGSLTVYGDYAITGYSYLKMSNPIAYVLVDGDFTMQSKEAHDNFLTSGTLEVKGNFYQKVSNYGNNNNFHASDNHTVILSGESQQTVSFDSAEAAKSHFCILQIVNPTEINFITPISVINNISEISSEVDNLTLIDTNWTLLQDVNTIGSLMVKNTPYHISTINLGNHTLQIADNLTMGGNGTSGVKINLDNGILKIGKDTTTTSVYSNLFQKSGTINVDNGSLEISGDYKIEGYSFLKMLSPFGYVKVGDNFTMQSKKSHDNFLTNGILDVKGNFKQIGLNGGGVLENFHTSDNFSVVLSGNSPQIVSFDSYEFGKSNFTILELMNPKEIIFATPLCVRKNIINSSGNNVLGSLTLINSKWSLNEDIVIDGALNLKYQNILQDETILDLNGYTLRITDNLTMDGPAGSADKITVKLSSGNLIIDNETGNDSIVLSASATSKGDLIQKAGTVDIDKGSLQVKGDYIISGFSYLKMVNDNDAVTVLGNFLMQSRKDHENYLTAGVLEVKGDFTQKKDGIFGNKNFYASGSHKVQLSGNSMQNVFFESAASDKSHFNKLEINNPNGIMFSEPLVVSDNIITSSGTNFGSLTLEGTWTLTDNVTINGNLTVKNGSFLSLNGKVLHVTGNLNQLGGTISIDNGTLIVDGYDNITGSSYFVMNYSKDKVIVNGDFIMQSIKSHTGKLTAGSLDIKGNFAQKHTSTSQNFAASGTHKVIFSGGMGQKVEFNDPGSSQFAILTVKNANIHFASDIKVASNIVASPALPEIRLKNTNWKLTGNVLVKDNLTISGTSNISLNGKVLHVTGNLNQLGGTISIDNGTLIVDGYDNITGSSYFVMNNKDDNVSIGGDFIMQSIKSHTGKLTAGSLDIKGNFAQKHTSTSQNFAASGTHKVIFSGGMGQKVEFDDPGSSQFAILVISNQNINFATKVNTQNLFVSNCINTSTANIDNVTANNKAYFCNNSIFLTDNKTIDGDFAFVGTTLDLNGYKLTIKGNFIHKKGVLKFNSGSLIVEGNYDFIESSYISMASDKDYLEIKGNFKVNSSSPVTIDNGTIALKGDLDITSIFKLSGNNMLKFGGDSSVNISIAKNLLQPIDSPSLRFANVLIVNSDISCNVEKIKTDRLIDAACNLSEDGLDYLKYFKTIKRIINCNAKTMTFNDNLTVPASLFFDNNSDIDLSGNTLDVFGNFYLINSEFNLNGGNLKIGFIDYNNVTVSAFDNNLIDFIQDNSTLYVDGGNIAVNGDYTIKGSSILQMTNAQDNVSIKGNFIMKSSISHENYLSNGKIYVGGDITQKNGDEKNLHTSGNNKVFIFGDSQQIISFESPDTYFETLVLKNTDIKIASADNSSLKVHNLQVANEETLKLVNIEYDNATFIGGMPLNKFELSLNQGWNLVSDPIKSQILEMGEKFSESIKIIWKWHSGKWLVWVPDNNILATIIDTYNVDNLSVINPGEGYWINADKSVTILFYGDEYTFDNITDNMSADFNGWCLLGAGKDITVSELKSFTENIGANLETAWKWESNKWKVWSPDEALKEILEKYLDSFNSINRGEGFWVYVNTQ